MNIAIVDYGMGNLHSVLKSVQAARDLAASAAQITLTDRPEVVWAADKIVFPAKALCPTVWRPCSAAVWAKRWPMA